MNSEKPVDYDRIDRLTNAASRLRIQELLSEQASGEGPPFGVAVIDLDGFTGFQREHGVVISDALLLSVYKRINRHVGDDEVLARIDRCRFGILSNAVGDPRVFASRLDKVREAVRAPVTIIGRKHVVTASIGIAFAIPGKSAGDEVLHQAEAAMLTARHRGGNTIEVLAPTLRLFKLPRFKALLRRPA